MDALLLGLLVCLPVAGILWFRSKRKSKTSGSLSVSSNQFVADAERLEAEARGYDRNYPRIAAFKRGMAEHLRDLARKQTA